MTRSIFQQVESRPWRRYATLGDVDHPNKPWEFSQLKPRDGTAPFYADATHEPGGWDDDDKFVTSPGLDEFDGNGDQVIPPTRLIQPGTHFRGHPGAFRSEDKRFMLVSHAPEAPPTLARRGIVVEKRKRGVVLEHADVLISLSPEEEDSLLLPSKLLAACHPFFRAAFASCWAKRELDQDAPAIGKGIKYLYELELQDGGEAILVAKSKPTPPNERRAKWAAAADRHQAATARGCRFDDASVGDVAYWAEAEAYQVLCIAAHKIGFAMVCGFPLRVHRTVRTPLDPDEDGGECMIALVLKIMDWIHNYGSYKSMAPEMGRFIFKRIMTTRQGVLHSSTIVRIATILQSESLFRKALANSVKAFLEDISRTRSESTMPYERLLQSLGHDFQLIQCVTREAGHMKQLVTDVYESMLRLSLPIDPETGHKPTVRFANEVWRSWFAGAAPDVGEIDWPIRKLLDNTPSAEELFEGHKERFYEEDEKCPPDNVDKCILFNAIETLLEQAQELAIQLLDYSGEYIGEYVYRWNVELAIDFEGYRYPWQLELKSEPSRLTFLEENPAIGDRV